MRGGASCQHRASESRLLLVVEILWHLRARLHEHFRFCSELIDSPFSFSLASASAPSSSGGGGGATRQPTCARCKNHGLTVQLRGHKRHCQFNECSCVNCGLILKRRRVMAMQVSLRRAQAQDEASGRAAPPTGKIESASASRSDSPAVNVVATSALVSSILTRENRLSGQQILDDLRMLMRCFRLTQESAPLLLIILRNNNFTLKDVHSMILDAQKEVVGLEARETDMNTLCFSPYGTHLTRSSTPLPTLVCAGGIACPLPPSAHYSYYSRDSLLGFHDSLNSSQPKHNAAHQERSM